MKRIFVDFYGALNIGDDLFIKILVERYPEHVFILILDEKYRAPFINYKNIIFINPIKINFLFRAASKFNKRLKGFFSKIVLNQTKKLIDDIFIGVDGYINIGGSIFMEPKSITLHDILYEYKANKLKSNKFIIGANFGPYSSESFKNKYRNIFSNFTDVSFRDTASKLEFPTLTNIRVNPDVVFQLNAGNAIKRDKKECIGISIINLKRRNIDCSHKDYFLYIVDLIEKYTSKGKEVKLFSFCFVEGDLDFAKEIMSKLSPSALSRVSLINYEGDIDKLIFEISTVTIMYATRFHAMILGFMYCDIVIPISYSKKMDNLLKDINFNGQVVDIKNILDTKSDVINNNKSNSLNLNTISLNSEKHFDKLDVYLKG